MNIEHPHLNSIAQSWQVEEYIKWNEVYHAGLMSAHSNRLFKLVDQEALEPAKWTTLAVKEGWRILSVKGGQICLDIISNIRRSYKGVDYKYNAATGTGSNKKKKTFKKIHPNDGF